MTHYRVSTPSKDRTYSLRQQTIWIDHPNNPDKRSIIVSDGVPNVQAQANCRQLVKIPGKTKQFWVVVNGGLMTLEAIREVVWDYALKRKPIISVDLAQYDLPRP